MSRHAYSCFVRVLTTSLIDVLGMLEAAQLFNECVHLRNEIAPLCYTTEPSPNSFHTRLNPFIILFDRKRPLYLPLVILPLAHHSLPSQCTRPNESVQPLQSSSPLSSPSLPSSFDRSCTLHFYNTRNSW